MPRLLSYLHRLRYYFAWAAVAALAVVSFVVVVNLLHPLPPAKGYAQLLQYRNGAPMHAFLSPDDKWRFYAEAEDVSPLFRQMLLEKEDRYFYRHPGVNPLAILRAAAGNLRSGKRSSGASTISMQVVRLLQPKPRTLANKIIEACQSLALEQQLTKNEIFELYLNLLPYGGNIEGIRSAALLYYNKEPAQLSAGQAALLSVVPNRPSSLALRNGGEELKTARNKWLQRYAEAGIIDSAAFTAALSEPLELERQPAPKQALHLANHLHRQYPKNASLKTTLSPFVQQKAEQQLKQYMQRYRHYGVFNAAALVVDNATGEVVAYVGSPDATDAAHAGQVDAVQAVRSPGSTLKPFIYGWAFDAGIITPKMPIADVATSYHNYAPENFDERFHGNVQMQQALGRSLNVPAVKMLHQLGTEPAVNRFILAGVQSLERQKHQLGLSLALGGCGLTLAELTGLYSAVARGGNYQPLQYTKANAPDGSEKENYQLLSPAAAYVVTEILSELQRPDFPYGAEQLSGLRKIAWKTGTSYGRRDAWSVGYNQQYTIGVWLGNATGEGVPQLVGAQAAAPLLFKLFSSLSSKGIEVLPQQPERLAFRFVCTESGLPPAEFCKNQQLDWFVPGVSPSAKCTHLKLRFVSANEEQLYCAHCLPAAGYKRKYFANLPAELVQWHQAEGVPLEPLPPHNLACRSIRSGEAPVITSPVHQSEYILPDPQAGLVLNCQAPQEVHQVWWYVNDKLLKEADPQEDVFIQPEKGKLKITCADDLGRKSSVEVVVR